MQDLKEPPRMQSWKDIVIPGFDEMVAPEDLFALCVLIGNAIFTRIPIVVGLEGDAASGKTTMCKIIQKLAEKNNLGGVFVGDEVTWTELFEQTQKHPSICYFLECDVPKEFFTKQLITWNDSQNVRRKSFWNTPTFYCCLAIGYQHGGRVIPMVKPTSPSPGFLDSININLVEEKCWQALMYHRDNLSNDYRLNGIYY